MLWSFGLKRGYKLYYWHLNNCSLLNQDEIQNDLTNFDLNYTSVHHKVIVSSEAFGDTLKPSVQVN